MRKISQLVMVLVAAFSTLSAFAKGQGNLERPIVIRMKATDLYFRPMRNFECTLESAPTGSWFLDQKITLNVSARSLQDAVELALTPYVSEPPKDANPSLKIVVNGKELKVRDVTCKAVQSI